MVLVTSQMRERMVAPPLNLSVAFSIKNFCGSNFQLEFRVDEKKMRQVFMLAGQVSCCVCHFCKTSLSWRVGDAEGFVVHVIIEDLTTIPDLVCKVRPVIVLK